MYILTCEWALALAFSQFLQFPPSPHLLLFHLLFLFLSLTGSSFNYRNNASQCESLYYPLVVNSSITRRLLARFWSSDHRLPLSHDIDGMKRKLVSLRDYDIVINRCHKAREAVSNLYCCERFYLSSDVKFFSINFLILNRKLASIEFLFVQNLQNYFYILILRKIFFRNNLNVVKIKWWSS